MATSRELQKRRDDKIEEVLQVVNKIVEMLEEANESKNVQSIKESSKLPPKKTK